MYKFIKILCFTLTIIGALNWGLVGLFRFDLVATLFGDMTHLTRIIYILVGLSGLALLVIAPKCCCKKENY